MNELAKCRLCGSEPVEVERIHAHAVSCRTCGLQVRQSEMGQGDAADRWNRLNVTPVIGTRYRDESGEVVAVVVPVESTDDMCHEALYQFVDRGRGMGFALRCAILAAPGTPSE